ncbi:MAG: hypothetical protein JWN04_4334, partial [Myxococcaceae bacterium]|nr:hypothetical protein [Myxococcaceae bacterium]
MTSTRLSRRALLKVVGLSLAGSTLACGDGDYQDIPNVHGSRLYPTQSSLLAGETLTLHVSTPAPQFRIDFFRQGASSELIFQSDWRAGAEAQPGRPDLAFDFPPFEFAVPASAPPGVYIAKLVEGEGGAPASMPSPAARAGKAQTLFVVRTPPGSANAILYKLPLATYQAYNFTGGGSLYHTAKDHTGRPRFDLTQEPDPMMNRPGGSKVTLLRPGNGTGGDAWHQESDPYDGSSARNTFEHWDAPFIAWLEREGYRVDYCVDLDVHRDASILAPYRLLICAGHDEYWSEEQRDHTEAFVAAGGNIGFFTGNTCWWRVHYADGDTAMVCDKGGGRPDQWCKSRPENSLTGVSYRNAGSWWQSKRTVLGYTVQHADHWVYANTGVVAGSIIGEDPDQPLVGYECDGAPFQRDADGLAIPAGGPDSDTPEGFLFLGVAELSRAWPTRLGQGA